MIKIAVLDDWQNVAQSSADWTPLTSRADVVFFHAPFGGEDEAAEKLAPFAVILATRERTPFPSTLVARLPNLRMFGLTGHRAALVDIAGMVGRGITVCNTGGGPSVASTAEMALGLMLAATRDIPAGDRGVRAGNFQLGTRPGTLLSGKTLGLIGLGRIGSTMARYGVALGMRVIAWSPNLTDERASDAGVTRTGKDELMSTSDVVSLHLVLSERTRGILGAADLARMKRGAILVNTARGPLVDEASLVAAVQSGRIIAALDVFQREPLPSQDPLALAANTVLTPHLGYSVTEVYADYYRDTVDNVVAFLDGKPIREMSGVSH